MGFLDSILPTAGGIIGGIGGAALGAVAAPFTGGIVNPIDAGLAGAGIGDTAGRAGENILTHQNVKNDLGSSFVQGVVGQGTGDIGGALIGKGLDSLSNKGAEVATNTLQSQFKAPIDQGVTDYIRNSGVNDARQVDQITPLLSGPQGAYTNMVNDSLQQAGENGARVNVSNLDSQLGSLLQGGDTGTGAEILTKGQANKVSNFIQNVISPDNLNASPEEDRAIMTTTPDKTYQAFTKLRNASNILRNGVGSQPGTANHAMSQIYGKMASYLKDASFSPDGITPLPITDDMKSQLIDQIAPLKNINPKVYSSEVQNITNAKNLSELNDMQTNWVQGQKALTKGAITGAVNTGTSASDIAAGIAPISLSHPVMTLAGLAMKSPTADRLATSALGKISDTTNMGTDSNASILSKALGLGNKDSGLVAKVLPLATRAAAVTGANIPNDISSSSVQSNNIIPTPAGATPMNPTATAQNPLAQLYDEIIAQSQSPTGISGNLISTANTLAPELQKQRLAIPVLSNILSAYQNAGGAQGLGQGLVSKLTGLVSGTPANTYNADSGAAAAQLASILGISPQEAATLLPQLTQTPGTAAPQVSGIQSILGNLGLAGVVPAM